MEPPKHLEPIEEKNLTKALKAVISKRRRTRQTLQPEWIVAEVMLKIDPYGEIERTNQERSALYRARLRAQLSSVLPPTPLEAWLDETGRYREMEGAP